jgi:uncharacterized membrane protein
MNQDPTATVVICVIVFFIALNLYSKWKNREKKIEFKE